MKKTFCFVLTLFILILSHAQINRTESSCKAKVLQKWEILSQEGHYDVAIFELKKQINLGGKKTKHRDYWHLGQLYAFKNDYDTAIIYIRKSTNIVDLLFDKYWRYYYKGTMAFLKRDKDKLYKYYMKMEKENSAYYEGNTNILKSLYLNFEKQYLDAYNCK